MVWLMRIGVDGNKIRVGRMGQETRRGILRLGSSGWASSQLVVERPETGSVDEEEWSKVVSSKE